MPRRRNSRGQFEPTDRQLEPSEVYKYASARAMSAEATEEDHDDTRFQQLLKRLRESEYVSWYLSRRRLGIPTWPLTGRVRVYVDPPPLGTKTRTGTIVFCGLNNHHTSALAVPGQRFPDGWGEVVFFDPTDESDRSIIICPDHHVRLTAGTGISFSSKDQP